MASVYSIFGGGRNHENEDDLDIVRAAEKIIVKAQAKLDALKFKKKRRQSNSNNLLNANLNAFNNGGNNAVSLNDLAGFGFSPRAISLSPCAGSLSRSSSTLPATAGWPPSRSS